MTFYFLHNREKVECLLFSSLPASITKRPTHRFNSDSLSTAEIVPVPTIRQPSCMVNLAGWHAHVFVGMSVDRSPHRHAHEDVGMPPVRCLPGNRPGSLLALADRPRAACVPRRGCESQPREPRQETDTLSRTVEGALLTGRGHREVRRMGPLTPRRLFHRGSKTYPLCTSIARLIHPKRPISSIAFHIVEPLQSRACSLHRPRGEELCPHCLCGRGSEYRLSSGCPRLSP